jgi:hypothetical protein
MKAGDKRITSRGSTTCSGGVLKVGSRCKSAISCLRPNSCTHTPARDAHSDPADVQPLSFSASSMWGVSARFRLQIGMIPWCEQSFGTPHVISTPVRNAPLRLASRSVPSSARLSVSPGAGSSRTHVDSSTPAALALAIGPPFGKSRGRAGCRLRARPCPSRPDERRADALCADRSCALHPFLERQPSARDTWAGVLPVITFFGRPEPSPGLRQGIPESPSITRIVEVHGWA